MIVLIILGCVFTVVSTGYVILAMARMNQITDELNDDVADLRHDRQDLARDVQSFIESSGGLWRTAQGDTLQIRDMDDAHIANAIESFKKRPHTPGYHCLIAERKRRTQGKKIQAMIRKTKRCT